MIPKKGKKELTGQYVRSVPGKIVLSVVIFSCFFVLSFSSPPHVHDHHKHETDFEKLKKIRATSTHAKKEIYGSWETVIPEIEGAAIHNILGMQTVHSVLLPSGKILLTSGSSWRNHYDVDYYPASEDPVPGDGLFNRHEDPFNKAKLDKYYQLVNNTAIYDPAENSFYRIPHPVPVDDPNNARTHFAPNDLFCSGHLQLPNGNALFVGGTQYYFPYRTGAQSTFIFDWRKELDINWKEVDWRIRPDSKASYYPWTFSGFMKRGRWYPSLVPLLDGRFLVFSGFVGFDKGFPEMYRFEINSYVEFFNPNQFDAKDPQKAWKAIDVKKIRNSPFTTRIYKTFEPTPCDDANFFPALGLDSEAEDFKPPCDCDERCMHDNLYDAFKLYPNNYLFPGNNVFLTREGDWVSLRTTDAAYMRSTKKTYWMNVEGTVDEPKVSFSPGPDRPEIITSYGASYIDPNSGNIAIVGGQPISAGTLFPLGSDKPTHFAGGRGSAKYEQFHPSKGKKYGGSWTVEDNFLGDYPQDDRTMLTAIVLPTRQVLIINGGNYDFYGPVHYPLLLTPVFDHKGKFHHYEKKRMHDAVEPRLYHNSALLLPDGRIWVSGGNSARASVRTESITPRKLNPNGQPKPNLDLVDLDMYFFRDGQMAKGQKGMLTTPTENWTAEIFSPPYLYIGGDYRPKITAIKCSGTKKGVTFHSRIGDKDYYLLQSKKTYQIILDDLPTKEITKKPELVLLKLPSFTHNWNQGQKFISIPFKKLNKNKIQFTTPDMIKNNIPPGFYMLFYVDARGKPSEAQMIRFDDKAITP
jgi:hypothetical protein